MIFNIYFILQIYKCVIRENFLRENLNYGHTLFLLVFKFVNREFPGGPVVRTPRFHCRGPEFNP